MAELNLDRAGKLNVQYKSNWLNGWRFSVEGNDFFFQLVEYWKLI